MTVRNKARLLYFAYLALLIVTENSFSFMIFNSFLAFAALEISYLLPLFRPRSKAELPAGLFVYLLFLLMSPNVFYIVTDLIHLNAFPFRYTAGLAFREWWHFFLLVAGVLLALFFYVIMVEQVRGLFAGKRLGALALLIFVLLESVGIFIGRFLRFHSVHLFTEPLALLRQFIDSLSRDAILFIGWISILQLMILWMFAHPLKEKRND
ncbi:DUF1361 domain-containing protein [Paenibacillus sp. 1011MAR3C5]|nr:DUF1361 domain-containing protein [Paenibacillus sp. 1011MAR3C5]